MADGIITAGSLAFTNTTPIEIYVRASDGNDSNPGTSAAPLATLIEAESRIPIFVNAPVIVHVGAHTGSGYAVPEFRSRILHANVYVIGDGAGVGDGFTELLASTAAGAGTDNTVVISSGMTINEYAGKTIEILSGAAIGDRRTIRNNTATQIYPTTVFSASVAQNDLFRIVEPAIGIYDPDGSNPIHDPPLVNKCGVQSPCGDNFPYLVPRLYLINLSVSGQMYKLNSCGLCLLGVEFNGGVQLNITNSVIECGQDHHTGNFAVTANEVKGPYDDGLVSYNTRSWIGWGVNFDTFTIIGDAASVFEGAIVTNGTSAAYGLRFNWHYGAMHGDVSFQNWATVSIFTRDSSCKVLVNGTITIRQGVQYSTIGFAEFTSPGDGVIIRDFSFCFIALNTGNVGGIAMKTFRRGVIRVTGQPTLTGTGGDFSEDNGTTIRSNSALASNNTSFVDATWLSQIYRGDFP